MYRAIYKHRVSFIIKLFNDGIVELLTKKKLLVGTYLTNLELEGFGLILQHDQIDINIRPNEWSIVTYMEAAKQYLKLYKELYNNNLTLIDGHHNNFSLSFDGLPIWHDFGSIVELTYYNRLTEFMEYFYYPLMFFKKTGSFPLIMRLGLRVSAEDYSKLLFSKYYRVIEKLKLWFLKAPQLIKLFHRIIPKILKNFISNKINTISFLKLIELQIINLLYYKINQIKYKPEKSTWSNYYTISLENYPNYNSMNPRSEAINNLLIRIDSNQILDLGANQGYFSHLAYKYCPVVIAADYDHSAVAKHAKFLLDSKASRRIYPVLIDMTTLSDNAKYRYKSDTVLALALTHHLRLEQMFPFDFIAKQLSLLSERYLITEFMPNGLGIGKVFPDPLPDDYTLESFLISLHNYFNNVTVIDYPNDPKVSPRILILCNK